MKLNRNLLVPALTAFLSACSIVPAPPPNVPPPMPVEEIIGDSPGVPHSAVIEMAGAPVVSTEAAAAGDQIIKIPYRYKHTAILTEDVKGFSITVWNVQAHAGAPGYYGGSFYMSGRGSALSDVWCFVTAGAAGKDDDVLCLYRNQPSIAAIFSEVPNPYLPSSFRTAGTFDYVKTPIFERKQVNIPGALVLEYRFEGWSPKSARLSEYAVGRKRRNFEVARNPDGAAVLNTVGGKVELTPVAADPKRTAIRLVSP